MADELRNVAQSFFARASRGSADGPDLVLPASVFTDAGGTAVLGGFPVPHAYYVVRICGVVEPVSKAEVSKEAATLTVHGGAGYHPATPITVTFAMN